jgi:hypothetical protein
MKRLIIIWVAVVVCILGIGIIAGQIQKNKEPEIPEIIQQEVIIGYDEDGNAITGMVDQNEETIKIDGESFSYNTGAFVGKTFKIDGAEFDMKLSIDELLDAGFEVKNTTWFTKGESTVIVNYNQSSKRALSINAYTQKYLDETRLRAEPCEDFEMPSGLKLGKSTLEDFQRVYGVSIVYKNGNMTTTKYYLDEGATTGYFVLYFDNENILTAIEIGCDYFSEKE